MLVTINSVTPMVGKTSNKPYQKVVYNGDKSASAFEDDFNPYVNKQVDVEISTKGQYTNVKLAGSMTAPATPAASVGASAPMSEIRKSAFLLALEAMKISGKTVSNENIKAEVRWIENYLVHGFEEAGAPQA